MNLILINSISSNPIYSIKGYDVISSEEIIFYVTEFNSFQNEIPKSIDGLNVKIEKYMFK